jgi:hypothetical protein
MKIYLPTFSRVKTNVSKNENMVVKKSGKNGSGLFAVRHFKTDDIILDYEDSEVVTI